MGRSAENATESLALLRDLTRRKRKKGEQTYIPKESVIQALQLTRTSSVLNLSNVQVENVCQLH